MMFYFYFLFLDFSLFLSQHQRPGEAALNIKGSQWSETRLDIHRRSCLLQKQARTWSSASREGRRLMSVHCDSGCVILY